MAEMAHWTQNRSESSKPPTWRKSAAEPAQTAQTPAEEANRQSSIEESAFQPYVDAAEEEEKKGPVPASQIENNDVN